MSDDEKKRTRKPLGLKRAVDAGEVKQTFSHGRTNKVAVEVKRRRKLVKPGEAAPEPTPAPEPAPEPAVEEAKPEAKKAPAKKAAPAETAQERVKRLQREAEEERLKLAEENRKREEEKAKQAEVDNKKRAEEKRKAEEEAKAAAEAAAAAEAEAQAKAEAEATPAETGKKGGSDGPSRKFTPVARPEPKRPEKKKAREDKRGGERGDKRRSGKLTVSKALNEDEGRRARSLAALKRAREKERRAQGGPATPREKQVRDVIVPEAITVGELAKRMGEKGADLVKELFNLDMMVTVNQTIDQDTAELLVEQFGHNIEKVSESDVDIDTEEDVDPEETLVERPPVVTIMGHVDHGKTSLLDALRGTDVTKGEAGGITQHIGSYQITTKDKKKITFLDTPGHAAFSEMRARGANVTDIVVLVVAADDGIMPQTIEAINHTKAAGVPMIVAINKIDKPQADPNRVRTELLQHEVVVESMSGETLEVPVSALQRTNLDKLLEAIHLQAELLDLKANPNRSADGIVVEAKLERGRGPVGTVLVQRGTLHVGDIVVAGTAWGRVRALIDDRGQNTTEGGPSVPVEILGFDSAPEAGDQFAVVENEARAREITDYRMRKRREALGSAGTARTLEQMMQQLQVAGHKEFPLVVKGDVQGSVEAIAGALKKLGTEEVEARIVHSGVGGITESDVSLANASKAVVVGFNVRANAQAKSSADRDGVEIRYYNIIYDLVDDVKAAMSGLLAPTIREIFLGKAEILEVFNISNVGKVAGCRIAEGKVERGAKVRLIRDDVVIHEGTLSTLKRFKDEVKEVPAGQECGMAFANYQDIRAGDFIECFNVETVQRSL